MTERHPAEKDALTVRTTSTGMVVVSGPCPYCKHDAMDHWSDGCKGARGGADHCRMTPDKLAPLARVIPPVVTEPPFPLRCDHPPGSGTCPACRVIPPAEGAS